MTTRFWLSGLAALLALPAIAAPATLYVYLPTKAKPMVLERELEAAMPGVDVTAFGRVADLKSSLESAPPDAILSLKPVLDELKLSVGLQGVSGGSESELYLLLSVDSAVSREQLGEKTIGTVDLLGRKRMGTFIGLLLKASDVSKIQSVTKTEDLLPLLQFKTADVVMLPESSVNELVGKSALNLQVNKFEGASVGLAAVAFTKPDSRPALEKALSALPKDVLTKLGLDGWKVRAP